MLSFLIGGAARNDRGVNGGDDGGTQLALVDGVLLLDYVRRRGGNTKPMKR